MERDIQDETLSLVLDFLASKDFTAAEMALRAQLAAQASTEGDEDKAGSASTLLEQALQRDRQAIPERPPVTTGFAPVMPPPEPPMV